MPTIYIDEKKIQAPPEATIFQAAQTAGIEIPTMCYLPGFDHSTSCMVCVVEVQGESSLIASCAAPIKDGMKIKTNTKKVLDARRTAVELLASDHLGDCTAPCQLACPAGLDIPEMIRQIESGNLPQAAETVKRDIPIPAVLGRICPAPCEKACRRKRYDQPVAICLLKRYVADVDLASESPYKPKFGRPSQNVAVIGAGPAGISAAYYLRTLDIQCTVYDSNNNLGGQLRTDVSRTKLPLDVLDKEMEIIKAAGFSLSLNTTIGKDIKFEKILENYDAVFIATGDLQKNPVPWLPIEKNTDRLKADLKTFQTKNPKIFAGGDIIRKRKLTVRSVGDGKQAALAIKKYLDNQPLDFNRKTFATKMGILPPEKLADLAQTASSEKTVVPTSQKQGYSSQEALKEAQRCLHCDCRKKHSCKLRKLGTEFNASPSAYKGKTRPFEIHHNHPEIIYEPAKCIDCGICIKIAQKNSEKLGLAFIGRGFNVKVAVPFDEKLKDGLTACALQCVENCPTGALAKK